MQIELVNQLRAVKGKLNLRCAHLKTVCQHQTTLEDSEREVDTRQYQCKPGSRQPTPQPPRVPMGVPLALEPT
eukprot:3681968-Rhodomonas_salina.4